MLGDLFGKKQIEERANFGPTGYGLGALTTFGTLGLGGGWTPQVVTEGTALAVPALWRGVNLIAGAIASMPIEALRDRQVLDPAPQIITKPDPRLGLFESIFAIVTSLLLRGNAYALLGGWTRLQYPTQMLLVHPDLVSVTLDPFTGVISYYIGGREYAADEVLHIRGFMGAGGIQGVGMVEAHRQGIGHSLDLTEYSSKILSESAVPPAAITVPGDPDAEETQAIKSGWVAAHGRSREPAVLTNGMTVESIAFKPEDMQFLESRQFSLTEIANIVGLPPHYVGALGDKSTYTNVESEGISLLKFSLMRWLRPIEEAFADLLPRGTDVQFNVDGMLRGDTLARYQAHALALGANGGRPFMLIDEIRDDEGLPALTPEQKAELMPKPPPAPPTPPADQSKPPAPPVPGEDPTKED